MGDPDMVVVINDQYAYKINSCTNQIDAINRGIKYHVERMKADYKFFEIEKNHPDVSESDYTTIVDVRVYPLVETFNA